MKAWLTILAALATTSAARTTRTTEPGLPIWAEGEKTQLEESGWIAGGLLLTDDPVPAEEAETEPEPLDVAQPTSQDLAGTETPADEIPERFWPAYFDARPESFLIDPQGLLGPVDYRDRLGFLNYHAGDSSIDLFVYVFKGEQDIPGEVREEELVERFFATGRPAAVVYYYLGTPQRSVLYLSPSLTDSISAAEQRRALESSVMQAFEKTDPAAQIEAFLVQMSIRIYWMERMLGGDGAAAVPGDADAALPAKADRDPADETKAALLAKLQPWLDRCREHALPAACGFSALVAAWIVTVWWRGRARYHFPDFEVEPRLGGAHAAGVGAVISFASAAIPPASQRDQVPDYLRRA